MNVYLISVVFLVRIIITVIKVAVHHLQKQKLMTFCVI